AFDKPFSGIVRRINPSVSQSTRTFEVEVLIPNADGLLKPGGFAKAAIAIRVDPTGVTVPVDAVVTFAGITKIFLMKDGKAREVRVTTGVQQTDWVEI